MTDPYLDLELTTQGTAPWVELDPADLVLEEGTGLVPDDPPTVPCFPADGGRRA